MTISNRRLRGKSMIVSQDGPLSPVKIFVIERF